MDAASIDVRDDAGAEVVVAVSGEVDLAVRDELQDAINRAVNMAGRRKVVVDLAGTSFLDSSGIAALVAGNACAAAAEVRLEVVGATGMVREVLSVTGVLDMLAGKPLPF